MKISLEARKKCIKSFETARKTSEKAPQKPTRSSLKALKTALNRAAVRAGATPRQRFGCGAPGRIPIFWLFGAYPPQNHAPKGRQPRTRAPEAKPISYTTRFPPPFNPTGGGRFSTPPPSSIGLCPPHQPTCYEYKSCHFVSVPSSWQTRQRCKLIAVLVGLFCRSKSAIPSTSNGMHNSNG